MYTVTPVGGAPGGEAFLITTPEKTALVDSGFAFSAPQTAANIERALGRRPLDMILLTHTHYDHASGSVCVKERWPGAEIVAGTYAARVFKRPGARETIRKMNRAAAAERGISWDDPAMPEKLRVDREVREGDVIDMGSVKFTVFETPGHTKCSICFYSEEERLLLSNETLGILVPEKDIVYPSFLVSYVDSIASLRKVMTHPVEHILFPHVGLLEGQVIRGFFPQALFWFEKTKDAVCGAYLTGARGDDLIAVMERMFYDENALLLYPRAAFLLNASYMVPMLIRECLGIESFDLPHEVRE